MHKKISILHKKLPHEFSLIQLQDKLYWNIGVCANEPARATEKYYMKCNVYFTYIARVLLFFTCFSFVFLFFCTFLPFVVSSTFCFWLDFRSIHNQRASMKFVVWKSNPMQQNGEKKPHRISSSEVGRERKKCAQIFNAYYIKQHKKASKEWETPNRVTQCIEKTVVVLILLLHSCFGIVFKLTPPRTRNE